MAYDGPDLSPLLQYGLNQTTPITSLGEEQNRLLELARQFDPDASWKYQDNSGSSNEGGSQAASNYVLDFDHTKFPTALPGSPEHRQGSNMTGLLNSTGEVMGMTSLADPDSYASNNVLDSRYELDTPYGRMTPSRNIREDTSAMDSVFQYAPMAILALATLGSGAPFMSGLSGALGASGATGMEAILGQLMPGLLQSGANGRLNYGSLANIIARMAGAPGWAGSLASAGTNYLTNGRKGP